MSEWTTHFKQVTKYPRKHKQLRYVASKTASAWKIPLQLVPYLQAKRIRSLPSPSKIKRKE